ncbi:baeRF3 domain-containing protein [Roseiconus lacunae]|uniref:baeRF3 domain-containing protein n=1 Tax=Roseiconus lacunae TaxID=2605694 RepID=UPI001E2B4524|nr:hypothetical protein [Roseiconus lacunae]MCD0460598.1 hypothetical protein [Roseiconus lacunae]
MKTATKTELPSKELLNELANETSERCVSIYMKTATAGPETTQAPIRLKNLVRQAHEQLDGGNDTLKKALEEVAGMEHDSTFWQHQSHGLAILISPTRQAWISLPTEPKEEVTVGSHFSLCQLAAQSNTMATPLVLTLSWERASLLHVHQSSVTEVTTGGFPAAYGDIVTERDPEQQLQYHTQSGGSGGSDVAMYHGQGLGEQKIEADRQMYLNQIAKRLRSHAYDHDGPLWIMATEEVQGHFKSNCDLTIGHVISASPDSLNETARNTRLLETRQSQTHGVSDSLGEKLGNALGKGLGSTKLDEILLAALDGRVETLIVQQQTPVRGSFDKDKRSVSVSPDGPDNLLDEAVRLTIQTGGEVVVADERDSEQTNASAAIFRYSIGS